MAALGDDAVELGQAGEMLVDDRLVHQRPEMFGLLQFRAVGLCPDASARRAADAMRELVEGRALLNSDPLTAEMLETFGWEPPGDRRSAPCGATTRPVALPAPLPAQEVGAGDPTRRKLGLAREAACLPATVAAIIAPDDLPRPVDAG